MLNFHDIKAGMEKHVNNLMKNNEFLYVVDVDKDQLWKTYLNAIPEEHNKIYKTRREHDCSACRHFVKQFGNVVAINNGVVTSVWDFETGSDIWNDVAKKVSEFVKQHKIADVYLTKFNTVGLDYDMDQDDDGNPIKWEHFYAKIDPKFIYRERYSETLAAEIGRRRDNRHVFKRSLDELSLGAIETVLELINQGSLYKGDEYKYMIQEFRKHKKAYINLSKDQKELYTWEQSVTLPDSISKIRNTAIGTLLIDVTEGMELDQAVDRYEVVTAPVNYKRSKPIFTQKMLDDAQKTITDLGYLDSLQRRYANADDISVNNIIFINRDTAKRVQGGDLFAEMSKETKNASKKFSKVEEVGIEDFINNVVPTATEISAYVEGKHSKNFMSLVAPVNKESKTMFKWNNNFSWAYTGNVTDSMLKQNVKNAGGKVDGVLRFSIQWNDLDQWNQNDEDAHCIEPNKNEIYYAKKVSRITGGNLDVDIVHPNKNVPAVENITWPSLARMIPGVYKFFVHTFSGRGGRGGFRAEIEFNGEIHAFDYSHNTKDKTNVQVAEVTLDNNGNFSIKELLPSNVSSREIWGIHTNDFVPVSVICYSPNYWDEQLGIGNKHYFFMLKDCVNPELPNAWYNEFLNEDLYPKHKKVMEALGSKAHVQESDDQLSGLGFSSTKRDELVVKVKGNTERVMKVKF